jgi:hypothetical protein
MLRLSRLSWCCALVVVTISVACVDCLRLWSLKDLKERVRVVAVSLLVTVEMQENQTVSRLALRGGAVQVMEDDRSEEEIARKLAGDC